MEITELSKADVEAIALELAGELCRRYAFGVALDALISAGRRYINEQAIPLSIQPRPSDAWLLDKQHRTYQNVRRDVGRALAALRFKKDPAKVTEEELRAALEDSDVAQGS